MTLKEFLESKGVTIIQWDGKTKVKGLAEEDVFDALPYVKYKFVGRQAMTGDYLFYDSNGQSRWLIHKKDFESIEAALKGKDQ